MVWLTLRLGACNMVRLQGKLQSAPAPSGVSIFWRYFFYGAILRPRLQTCPYMVTKTSHHQFGGQYACCKSTCAIIIVN